MFTILIFFKVVTNQLSINFVWYNTLGYASSAAVISRSIQFECANVVYNVAALYSYLAVMLPRSTDEGLKQAFQWFQLSAGTFRLLIDEILPEIYDPPIGLDANSLETLYYLNLAQAQESFWQKAVANGTKDGLIAKLAMQTSYLYEKCLGFANKSAAIRSEWISHVTCKQYHFEAAGQYRAALDCLSKSKYGEEVARLRASAELCKKALSSIKYVGKEVLEDLQGLNLKVQTDLKGAEKDNDLIYLQEIPSTAQLAAIPVGSVVAQPLQPSQMTNTRAYLKDKGLYPLFESLVPFTVIQAAKIYKEKVEEYVYKNIISEIEKLTRQLHASLQEMSLPGALEALEKPLGVPANVLESSEDVRSKGGVGHLHESIKDNDQLAAECRNLLNEIQKLLQVEEEEDAFMRSKLGTARWNRLPSDQANVELREDFTRFAGFLSTAESSDRLVKEKLSTVSGILETMSHGKEAIEAFLPNSKVVRFSPYMERAIGDLREVLSRSRGVERRRETHLANLNTALRNVDLYPHAESILKVLRQSDPYRKVAVRDFEPVLSKALNDYDQELRWVQQESQEQDRLVELIQNRNNVFIELSENDVASVQRQTAIQTLEVAHFKFTEIRNNLDEGLQFYNTLLAQLRTLLERCQNFVYERRLQGTALESGSSESPKDDSRGDDELTPIVMAPQARPSPGLWSKDSGIRFG